jgi:putative toxin-antitoxin system antitoxin component (TIGR02293 family)
MERLGGYKVFGKRVATPLQLDSAVRQGLPAAALEQVLRDLVKAGVPQSVVYGVVGSARTLQRKRAAHTRLSADESDRLTRLARVMVRAEEALGQRQKAHRWLGAENVALGGAMPLALLASDAGAQLVEQLLGQIEHGIVG